MAGQGPVPLPERGSSETDPFLRSLAGVQGVRVDPDHVANLGVFLAKLSESIDTYVRGAARAADEALRVGNYGEVAFGDRTIKDVKGLGDKSHRVYEMVDTNLLAVMTSVDETAETLRQIAKRYRNEAELSRITMADARKIFPPR